MNKHLLALATGVATLTLTTAASAQSNKAYTDQIGDIANTKQTIDITQSGNGGQVGYENGRILQNGGGNSLTITQSGTGNIVGAPKTQDYNSSQQVGNGNSLNIDQDGGTKNAVAYSQTGNSNGRRSAGTPPDNRRPTLFGAPVNYGVYPGSAWNYIQQKGGDTNYATVNQSGDNNGLIVLQNGGARNTAGLAQGSVPGTGRDGGINLAYFNQSNVTDSRILLGQANRVSSSEFGAFNSADIRQLNGSNNFVGSTAADGYAIQDGRGLDLFAQQTGSYNQLNVKQVASNSRVEALQYGFGGNSTQRNQINVDQSGDRQTAIFGQYGYGNTATVTQRASGNTSIVAQGGTNNSLESTQDSGGSHMLFALQNGDSNKILNTQSGTSQVAYIYQTGTKNEATNIQFGTNQITTIDQSGSFNVAYNDQSGLRNISTITQSANNNTANVLQSGSFNTATVRQGR